MAEISDRPPPTSPTKTSDQASSTTRRNPPGRKRLILTLTVLSSFLVSLPFLLKSTEIHRSPLPHHSISSLSSSHSFPPPCRFQVVFLNRTPSSSEALGRAISDEMRTITSGSEGPSISRPCGSCAENYSISVVVDSGGAGCDHYQNDGSDGCLWQCGSAGSGSYFGGGDEDVDEFFDGILNGDKGRCGSQSRGKLYTMVVVGDGMGSTDDGKFRVVVGKHRHAWIVGKIQEMAAVRAASKVFVEVFMHGWMESNGMDDWKNEASMPIGSDGSVTLSFSLLNANPRDWVYDWDFKNTGEEMLNPMVEALAPLANVRVESQVLYHTPKSSFSFWDSKLGSHVFSTSDLPFFVNSKEWHLDTSIATAGRSKVLQFVVYVPSAKECPLHLSLSNKDVSTTNGFISPMWGGIHVWNPPTCSLNSDGSHFSMNMISSKDLHEVFQVFIGQIRLLFGLKSDNTYVPESEISRFLASERGFTEWELDFLFRRHTCFSLLSCSTTLKSLSNLVQSLPRMIVIDEIGKLVKLSLEAATLAHKNSSLGIYDGSAVSSRQARSLAEDAFFHSSIMSISYSSTEHYFAIYMPFFAPVVLHILIAAAKELKRYKLERKKFSVFIASQQQSAS